MASVTEQTTADTNGGAAAATIPVENPATGEVITTVAVLGADELAQMAARAREAQPRWEAIGFNGRGKVLKRAQKWMTDNTDRIIDVVMSEAGKTYEPVTYAGAGHGFMRSGEQPDASKENAEARTQAWARVKKIMSSH